MANIGEVYFGFYGDSFDPNEVSSYIGLEPTKVKIKGNPIPKLTSWIISLGETEEQVYDVYEKSEALLAILQPKQEQIVSAKDKFRLEAVFQVVLWISTDESEPTPAIGFNGGIIKFLANIGASIDIDTYKKS